jgi:DDE superfamily endonuclease
MQEAFAVHMRHVGRAYPAGSSPLGVLLLDKTLRHAGEVVRQAFETNPRRELKRLPSYSPQLNPIERLWHVLCRRATQNRLFDTVGDLRQSLRNASRNFQTVRKQVRKLIVTDNLGRFGNLARQRFRARSDSVRHFLIRLVTLFEHFLRGVARIIYHFLHSS